MKSLSPYRRYSIAHIFSYSGVSKLRIASRLILLHIWKLIGRRHVTAYVNKAYNMALDLKTPGLSSVLYVYGTREVPDTAIAKEIIKPGMVIADIGANIGYYALLEATLVGETGHVYAFEPDPRNVPKLKNNVSLNKMEERVTVYEQAVADIAGTKTFLLGKRDNVSSFVNRPGVVGSAEVECVTLHEFEHIEKVDMLRMDAEGYECNIIAGVIPYLRQSERPFTIMLEVHPAEYNDTDLNFREQLQHLADLNFVVSYVVANEANKEFYAAAGHKPESHWVETKHRRVIYRDVEMSFVLEAIGNNAIRAMVLQRG